MQKRSKRTSRPILDRLLTIAGLLIATCVLLGGCKWKTFDSGATGAPSVAIPDDCNRHLEKVPPADVKGDHAKVAWRKSEKQLDKANARIEAGAECWSGVVNNYRAGG